MEDNEPAEEADSLQSSIRLSSSMLGESAIQSTKTKTIEEVIFNLYMLNT